MPDSNKRGRKPRWPGFAKSLTASIPDVAVNRIRKHLASEDWRSAHVGLYEPDFIRAGVFLLLELMEGPTATLALEAARELDHLYVRGEMDMESTLGAHLELRTGEDTAALDWGIHGLTATEAIEMVRRMDPAAVATWRDAYRRETC